MGTFQVHSRRIAIFFNSWISHFSLLEFGEKLTMTYPNNANRLLTSTIKTHEMNCIWSKWNLFSCVELDIFVFALFLRRGNCQARHDFQTLSLLPCKNFRHFFSCISYLNSLVTILSGSITQRRHFCLSSKHLDKRPKLWMVWHRLNW